MTNRPESIRGCGYAFGCGAITAQNVAKALVPAKGRNSTAIGRGNRDVPVSLDWLISVALGIVVDDHKNCRHKVEAASNLILDDLTFFRQEEANALLNPTLKESLSIFRSSTLRDNPNNGDLFDRLSELVTVLAFRWGEEVHQNLRNGFSFTLSTSGDYAGVLCQRTEWSGNTAWWTRSTYRAKHTQGQLPNSRYSNAVVRQAALTIEHIEALAILFADSVRHLHPGRTGITAPRIEEIPELAAEVRPGSNENAGSPAREPASSRDQDRTAATRDTTDPDNGGESENSQAPRCATGRLGNSPMRRTTYARHARRHDSVQPAA